MNNKTLIKEIQDLLKNKFNGNISRVILYGSRSRGDYKEYSDYDILVIVKEDFDWKFEREINDSLIDIDLKYDILLDVRLISENEMKTIKGKQPFIFNALTEGIEA